MNQTPNQYQIPQVSYEADQPTTEEAFADIETSYIKHEFDAVTNQIETEAAVPIRVHATEADAKTNELKAEYPVAHELRRIGHELQILRQKQAESLGIGRKKNVFKRVVSALLTNDTAMTADSYHSKMIERESRIGASLFPRDNEVTSMKFFYLPNEQHDEWFHQQTSPNKLKNFTNSYIVSEATVHKSSTYFDVIEGRTKNILVVPDELELQHLLTAATRYYSEVTGKVYVKPAAPRLRIGRPSPPRS